MPGIQAGGILPSATSINAGERAPCDSRKAKARGRSTDGFELPGAPADQGPTSKSTVEGTMPASTPVLHGATVLLTVAVPRDTFATLQGIASADATCSVDWLARFALVDFVRKYADSDLFEIDQDDTEGDTGPGPANVIRFPGTTSEPPARLVSANACAVALADLLAIPQGAPESGECLRLALVLAATVCARLAPYADRCEFVLSDARNDRTVAGPLGFLDALAELIRQGDQQTDLCVRPVTGKGGAA